MAVQSVKPTVAVQEPEVHSLSCGQRAIEISFAPSFETSTLRGMQPSLVSAALAICRLAHLPARDEGSQAFFALQAFAGVEFLLDVHQAIGDEAKARAGGAQ